MGWFTKNCPRCGSPLEATGYSFPYPAYRCNNCIEQNEMKEELKKLQKQVSALTKEKENDDQ